MADNNQTNTGASGSTSIYNGSVGGTSVVFDDDGILALAMPLPMKNYISNDNRGSDGKKYVTEEGVNHKDDKEVSVKVQLMGENARDVASKLQGMESSLCTGKPITVTAGGVSRSCLYKSCSSASGWGDGFLSVNLNLIILASN